MLLSVTAWTTVAANPTAAPSQSGQFARPAAAKIGAFVPTQSLPASRWSHGAVILRNGQVLIAGGVGNATRADGGNDQVALDTAVLYDPSSGGFRDTGKMIVARVNPTATVLNDGRVLIVGGGQSGAAPGAELYDPSNGTFAPVSEVSQRVNHTATLLRDGRVLIVGGIALAEGSDASSRADIYDPAKGVFKPAAKMKSPRCRHSATLLLDGRVLIAGGSSFLWNVAGRDRSLASTEIYDPSTDTFSNGPEMVMPRLDHSATLLEDGSVLIADGDASGSVELYEPSKRKFVATGRMALSTSRSLHAAARLRDGRVLITGGSAPWELATAEIFDPATKTFGAVAPMIAPRAAHSATLLNDGRVLVVGGSNIQCSTLAPPSAELYDPDANVTTFSLKATPAATAVPGAFRLAGKMDTARGNHTATLLHDGKVLVAGGVENEKPVASAQLFDPATGTFATIGSMTTPRRGHSATLLRDGRVLIAGGDQVPDKTGTTYLTAELFDPRLGRFLRTNNMATGHWGHSATLLEDGRVLLAGGVWGPGLDRAGTNAQLYQSSTNEFTKTGELNTARVAHVATMLANGTVLVSGGATASDAFTANDLASTELYDPATGIFAAGHDMTTARAGHTATKLKDEKVLIAGGVTGGGNEATTKILATAELYDPATGAFKPTGNMTAPHAFHSATLLPSGKVLIVGGIEEYGTGFRKSSRRGELYDPSTGIFSATPATHEPRLMHTATLLSGGEVMILGGINAECPMFGFLTAEFYDP